MIASCWKPVEASCYWYVRAAIERSYLSCKYYAIAFCQAAESAAHGDLPELGVWRNACDIQIP